MISHATFRARLLGMAVLMSLSVLPAVFAQDRDRGTTAAGMIASPGSNPAP